MEAVLQSDKYTFERLQALTSDAHCSTPLTEDLSSSEHGGLSLQDMGNFLEVLWATKEWEHMTTVLTCATAQNFSLTGYGKLHNALKEKFVVEARSCRFREQLFLNLKWKCCFMCELLVSFAVTYM